MLYPLSFTPLPKERVWGGRNLATLYGKPLPPDRPFGESWEITDRPEGVSVIANGPLAGRDLRWLMEHHRTDLLGRAAAPGGRFPLLVKILDAREVLSVQVHPPAALAAKLGGEPKTEMWYVTRAAAGADILAGLRRGVTRDEFERQLRAGTVGDCIHRVPVRPGDAMFLPSGRVHALGANLVIFEIQQNSDTTYRVFDWNRLGTDGKPRGLHRAEAMASIDFQDFEPGLVSATPRPEGPGSRRELVRHPLFNVDEVTLPAGAILPVPTRQRPVLLGIVSGRGTVGAARGGTVVELTPGGFSVIPASSADARIIAATDLTLLWAEPGD